MAKKWEEKKKAKILVSAAVGKKKRKKKKRERFSGWAAGIKGRKEEDFTSSTFWAFRAAT